MKVGIVLFILLMVGAFIAFEGPSFFNFETLNQHKMTLLAYVEQDYTQSLVLAFVIYVLVVALSLPGAAFLSLVVGFVFGRWIGWLLLVLAATVGAVIVFQLVRYLFYDWAHAQLKKRQQAQQLMAGFEEDAVSYLLFLRVVPLFPFWLVNIILPLTTIKLRPYALGTFFGIMPGRFVFANLGQSLSTVEQVDQIFSLPLMVAFLLLGCLMLVPVWVKRRDMSNKS